MSPWPPIRHDGSRRQTRSRRSRRRGGVREQMCLAAAPPRQPRRVRSAARTKVRPLPALLAAASPHRQLRSFSGRVTGAASHVEAPTGEIGRTFRCSDALMHLLLWLPINLLSRGSRSAGQIVTRHQQADPQPTTCDHSPEAGKEKCGLPPGILVAIIIRHCTNPPETTPHSLLLSPQRVNHVTVSQRKGADKVLHAPLMLDGDLERHWNDSVTVVTDCSPTGQFF